MDPKSLSEQLMAGLTGDDTNNEVEETEEQETPEGEETPESDAPEGEIPEGDGENAEEKEDGEEDAEGEEAEDGEEQEGEETEEGAEGGKPKKAADPINDPLPKGTLESTRERFQHVVSQLKTETARADQAEAHLDELVGQIKSAGMDAEKYGVMLQYAAGVNSGDPEQMRRSYSILMQELTNLATALGEPLPGKNPLEGHADLIKLVEEKKVTPELAIETALNRNRQAAAQKLQQARQNSQQGDQAFRQAVQQSQQEFSSLGRTLAAKDGKAEYTRKAQIVIDMFQEAIMALPPAQRVAAFKKAYDKVPAAPKVQPKPGAKLGVPAKKGATPLRGNKRPAGNSTQKQPSTLLATMKQGLIGGE